jgi:hypothetical protein
MHANPVMVCHGKKSPSPISKGWLEKSSAKNHGHPFVGRPARFHQ